MQAMQAEDVVCEPEVMDSEDPLFLLYTSGSTGKPKALVHTQAGYLLYAALTHRVTPPPSGPASSDYNILHFCSFTSSLIGCMGFRPRPLLLRLGWSFHQPVLLSGLSATGQNTAATLSLSLFLFLSLSKVDFSFFLHSNLPSSLVAPPSLSPSPNLQYVFSYHDGDVFGCVADIGWITGHSYTVYGPLANGGTTVLFESTPIYPDPGGGDMTSLSSLANGFILCASFFN